MPSIRFALSTDEKIVAMYSDPAQYQRAAAVVEFLGHRLGTERYKRTVTHFLVDAEAAIHGSQSAAAVAVKNHRLWELRRRLCIQTTGQDLLLGKAPSKGTVEKWRDHLLPPVVDRVRSDGTVIAPHVWVQLAEEAYKQGIPAVLEALRSAHETAAMELHEQLRPSDPSPFENASRVQRHELLVADGTWVQSPSTVESTPYTDPDTGEVKITYAGTKAENLARVRLPVKQASKKDHGPSSGINHVAVLVRSSFGRVVLSVERAMGGEVHSALDALERIHAQAPERFRAIAYDAALGGWQADYVVAKFGYLPIAPLAASKGDEADRQEKLNPAQMMLRGAKINRRNSTERAQRAAAQRYAGSAAAQGTPLHLAMRELDAAYEENRAAGSAFPLGTAVTVDRKMRIPTTKRSYHARLFNKTHEVDGHTCEHDVYVDNGGVWTVTTRRGALVKDERLHAKVRRVRDHGGGYALLHDFTWSCWHTGEVFTGQVTQRFSTKRGSKAERNAGDNVRVIAEGDRIWHSIYGRRNDSESWFSWLKDLGPEHGCTGSMDLNHQFLEILHAAALTNSITRYYAAEAGLYAA